MPMSAAVCVMILGGWLAFVGTGSVALGLLAALFIACLPIAHS